MITTQVKRSRLKRKRSHRNLYSFLSGKVAKILIKILAIMQCSSVAYFCSFSVVFAGEKPKNFCNRFGAQLFAPVHCFCHSIYGTKFSAFKYEET